METSRTSPIRARNFFKRLALPGASAVVLLSGGSTAKDSSKNDPTMHDRAAQKLFETSRLQLVEGKEVSGDTYAINPVTETFAAIPLYEDMTRRLLIQGIDDPRASAAILGSYGMDFQLTAHSLDTGGYAVLVSDVNAEDRDIQKVILFDADAVFITEYFFNASSDENQGDYLKNVYSLNEGRVMVEFSANYIKNQDDVEYRIHLFDLKANIRTAVDLPAQATKIRQSPEGLSWIYKSNTPEEHDRIGFLPVDTLIPKELIPSGIPLSVFLSSTEPSIYVVENEVGMMVLRKYSTEDASLQYEEPLEYANGADSRASRDVLAVSGGESEGRVIVTVAAADHIWLVEINKDNAPTYSSVINSPKLEPGSFTFSHIEGDVAYFSGTNTNGRTFLYSVEPANERFVSVAPISPPPTMRT